LQWSWRILIRGDPDAGVYPVIFIDAMVVRIRAGQVARRPVYPPIGVTLDGRCDILGLLAGTDGEAPSSGSPCSPRSGTAVSTTSASSCATASPVSVTHHRNVAARRCPDERSSPCERYTGLTLRLAMMVFTVLPFISIFTTALQPSGALPTGLEWPSDPQWGNFVEACEAANMTILMKSSTLIVLMVIPGALLRATMAVFAIGVLAIPGGLWLLLLFVFGLALPFEGIVTPLYLLARDLGILNTRLAIALPLLGRYMPFAVF
jgi:hypothetical protein